ncbi:hypothetical protein M427DRAFT_54965 [Gonapodya prolifera JEL478]|uniref:Cytochrome b5 heme-binding domain-containing protein n=1 Tax=Gonapodya prolifera (strain JEL478) TaxID=1344416 RepID=A0A139AJQ2_GONPJ|nr:hypothetical protein M427DRAFT_54965 [Gonapodya prolifera JEL478]|eukprot:KXS16938.1 hypothetical protein M427DRAFT_54965 [Gonapodya prolifera JEL478]
MAAASHYEQSKEFPPLDSVTGGRSADLWKWLQSRRDYNSKANGLWRIHNGLYNLKEFVQKHPGGSEWLTMTEGSDITEAFEAHHPNIAYIREKILPKYYVRDADWPRESPLTFTTGGFYDKLRDRVRVTLKRLGPGPRRWTNFYADASALLFEGALGALAFVGPNVFGPGNPLDLGLGWTVGLSIGTGLIGGALVVMGHNFLHMKDNKRMYYTNIAGSSYRMFRIHHALSHHMYPNTSLDVEYPLFEPTLHFWPEMPRRKPNLLTNALAFQWFLVRSTPLFYLLKPVLWLTGTLRLPADEYLYWLNTFAGIGIRLFATQKLLGWSTVASSNQSLAYYLGISAAQVIATNTVVAAVVSIYTGNIGLYAGHHADYIWRQGDLYQPPLDFGLFQLEATADRVDVYNKGLLPVITTFGDHTLHHLFPTVDHAYHTYLYQDLAETCKEFNVRFEFTNYRDMFLGFYRSLARTNRTEHARRVGWDGKGYAGWVDPNMGTSGAHTTKEE